MSDSRSGGVSPAQDTSPLASVKRADLADLGDEHCGQQRSDSGDPSNAVAVDVLAGDLLDGDGGGAEVVLAGDILYDQSLVGRVLPFLHRLVDRGAYVLVGDPDRGCVPRHWLETVASYRLLVGGAAEDAQIERTSVLAPQRRRYDTAQRRGCSGTLAAN